MHKKHKSKKPRAQDAPAVAGWAMSRYYYYWIHVDRPQKAWVAQLIARRVEQNEHYTLYKDQNGVFCFCARAHELPPSKKHRDIVAVFCEFWTRNKSRKKILAAVAGRWGIPPEIETMHEMTGYDS